MEASAASVITPIVRSIIQRVMNLGQHSFVAGVHSSEARQRVHNDFEFLLEVKKRALIPTEAAELEGAVEAALRVIYTNSRREVWWFAAREAGSSGFAPSTFNMLEASRSATGVTPSRLHLWRWLADRKDLRRVAELHALGRVRPGRERWNSFWLEGPLAPTTMISLLTFPLSLPVAWVWRRQILRAETRRQVGDWLREQSGQERRHRVYRKCSSAPYGFGWHDPEWDSPFIATTPAGEGVRVWAYRPDPAERQGQPQYQPVPAPLEGETRSEARGADEAEAGAHPPPFNVVSLAPRRVEGSRAEGTDPSEAVWLPASHPRAAREG
ncbi:hypothetical protein ACFWBM_09375 [Streptomyces sp. NPDC059980]|uniref:hypothetical protein n=1 Tax=Streptomyces sp. NPDC059980 TaxID=3347022 RepID=UPI0036B93E51